MQYVDEMELARRRGESVMQWSFKRKLRTLRMPGDVYLKLRFATDAELAVYKAGAVKLGLPEDWFPSSWASVWHELDGMKRAPWSCRFLAEHEVTGGWEEARARIGSAAAMKEYDLCSAYAWAGHRKLPVVRSAWPARHYEGPGLYLVKILRTGSVILPPSLRPSDREPFPVRWVTHEEIEELDLTVATIRGVRFDRWWEPRARMERIQSVYPEWCWKKILKRYWGPWAGRSGLECASTRTEKHWELPSYFYDPAQAHFIVSRVRNRVAQVARNAVHVFVDAVITADDIATGEGVGDWRIKHKFKELSVISAGRWVDRVTGEKKNAGGGKMEAIA